MITHAGLDEIRARIIGNPVIYNGFTVAHVIDAVPSKIDNGQYSIKIKAKIPEEQGYVEDLMKTGKAFIDVKK